MIQFADRNHRSGAAAQMAAMEAGWTHERTLPEISGEASRTISARVAQKEKSGLSILTPDELPEWDALVGNSPHCSVFCKSWWLRAACGEVRVLGLFNSGRLIAGIPLHYERRMGMRVCCMPRLIQTMGVVIGPLAGKRVTAETRETEILDQFADRLSMERIFVQAFHPACQNWLPFYWRGYTQTTHYTYVFDELGSMHKIWDGLAQARRNNIRKAREIGISVRECGPEDVFKVAAQTFGRQGKECPYELDYLCRLYKAARTNEAGICMAAQDSQGRVHAAFFFIWDRKRGYNLAGGHDPNFASSGGGVLLMWNLIEFAAAHTDVFDFEGSMHRQIEASFRSFGGRRVAYHRIARVPRWLRMGLCAAGRVSI